MRILNRNILISHGNIQGRKILTDILEAGLQAVDPYSNMTKLFRIEKNHLILGGKDFIAEGDPQTQDEIIDLSKVGKIYVLGAGKGAQRIAKAIEDILGDRLTGGHIIDKKGAEIELKKIGVTLGAHPVPDMDCVKGCQKILEITKNLKKEDMVFTIASNGASSLLTLPVPGISLEDVQKTTYLMQIKRGAHTQDLNHVRNNLDMLKGGRITRHIWPARAIHLIAWAYSYDFLMNHNPAAHFLPIEESSYDQAIKSLRKWNAWEDVPNSVREHLLRGNPQQETVKIDEFTQHPFRVFCLKKKNSEMLQAAKSKAEEFGYKAVILSHTPQQHAEASDTGKILAGIATTIEEIDEPIQSPCVLLSTGEMLVTVGKENGIGGRNQEFALSAALKIQGSKRIVIGSVDTDGTDGPGNQFKTAEKIPTLAGGLVDGETVKEAKEKKIDIFAELKRHNSTPTLLKLDSGIMVSQNIGVRDLTVVLISKE